MLELRMSKDIKTFEPNTVGPCTFRQAIWITIGTVISVPLFFIIPGQVASRILVCTLVAAPLMMCGWIKVQGMYLDEYLKIVLKYMFLDSKIRLNTDENRLEQCLPQKHVKYKKSKDKNVIIYR